MAPAQIQTVSGHYLIQNMGSTNGIQVKGWAVKKTVKNPVGRRTDDYRRARGSDCSCFKMTPGHFIIHVDWGKDKDKVPLVNGEPRDSNRVNWNLATR